MSEIASHNEMIYRTLGITGERVSAIGVGGWHLGLKHVDEQLSFRIVRTAIDRGINFMDNCWDYNEGASEIRMGKAASVMSHHFWLRPGKLHQAANSSRSRLRLYSMARLKTRSGLAKSLSVCNN